jgi:hypothetical protein
VAPRVNEMTPADKAAEPRFRKLNKHLHMSVYALNIHLEECSRESGETVVMAVASFQQRC